MRRQEVKVASLWCLEYRLSKEPVVAAGGQFWRDVCLFGSAAGKLLLGDEQVEPPVPDTQADPVSISDEPKRTARRCFRRDV